MIVPRQKVSSIPFAKLFFDSVLKKNKKKKNLNNFFNLNKINNYYFVYKARIGLFHIFSYLKKKNKYEKKIILASPFTIFDVINMIKLNGFDLIFYDNEKNSTDLNLKDILKKISKYQNKIAGILITHYHLNNKDTQKLTKICKMKKIILIEDCSIALYSEFKSKLVGTKTDFAVFSFGLYKFINVLSGGVVISRSKDFLKFVQEKEKFWPDIKIFNLYKLFLKYFIIKFATNTYIYSFLYKLIKIAYLKDILFLKKFFVNDPNPHIKKNFPKDYQYKMADWQKSIINLKLGNLNDEYLERKENFNLYYKNIKNKKLAKLNRYNKKDYNKHSYLNFPIIAESYDNFLKYLISNDVDCSPQFYRSCNDLKIFKNFSNKTKNIQNISKKIITLPTYSGIKKEYILKVCKIVNEYK